ncbi:unnamed protein product [Amoebophrya sp. A120]|nr:unnamed protein product [Amoebophrya sp. A120]|eukprot:GSA120T00024141001.1
MRILGAVNAAVSQASPFRRLIVDGDFRLMMFQDMCGKADPFKGFMYGPVKDVPGYCDDSTSDEDDEAEEGQEQRQAVEKEKNKQRLFFDHSEDGKDQDPPPTRSLQSLHLKMNTPDYGNTSGGFMADVLVRGELALGSQQQFLFVNTKAEKGASGGAWSFVGLQCDFGFGEDRDSSSTEKMKRSASSHRGGPLDKVNPNAAVTQVLLSTRTVASTATTAKKSSPNSKNHGFVFQSKPYIFYESGNDHDEPREGECSSAKKQNSGSDEDCSDSHLHRRRRVLSSGYYLRVPALTYREEINAEEHHQQGTAPAAAETILRAEETRPFSNIFVARPEMEQVAKVINHKLNVEKKDIVFTPGIYQLTEPIQVFETAGAGGEEQPLSSLTRRPVLLGLGFAMLETLGTFPAMEIKAASPIVAGLTLQPGKGSGLVETEMNGEPQEKQGENLSYTRLLRVMEPEIYVETAEDRKQESYGRAGDCLFSSEDSRAGHQNEMQQHGQHGLVNSTTSSARPDATGAMEGVVEQGTNHHCSGCATSRMQIEEQVDHETHGDTTANIGGPENCGASGAPVDDEAVNSLSKRLRGLSLSPRWSVLGRSISCPSRSTRLRAFLSSRGVEGSGSGGSSGSDLIPPPEGSGCSVPSAVCAAREDKEDSCMSKPSPTTAKKVGPEHKRPKLLPRGEEFEDAGEGGQHRAKNYDKTGVAAAASSTSTAAHIKEAMAANEVTPSRINTAVLQDIVIRVGGDNQDPSEDFRAVDTMLEIDRSFVVLENYWGWRADHAKTGQIGNGQNPAYTGLRVKGNHVAAYGLAVEHLLKNQVEWTGDFGKTVFYQCELPYDIQPDWGFSATSADGRDQFSCAAPPLLGPRTSPAGDGDVEVVPAAASQGEVLVGKSSVDRHQGQQNIKSSIFKHVAKPLPHELPPPYTGYRATGKDHKLFGAGVYGLFIHDPEEKVFVDTAIQVADDAEVVNAFTIMLKPKTEPSQSGFLNTLRTDTTAARVEQQQEPNRFLTTARNIEFHASKNCSPFWAQKRPEEPEAAQNQKQLRPVVVL